MTSVSSPVVNLKDPKDACRFSSKYTMSFALQNNGTASGVVTVQIRMDGGTSPKALRSLVDDYDLFSVQEGSVP